MKPKYYSYNIGFPVVVSILTIGFLVTIQILCVKAYVDIPILTLIITDIVMLIFLIIFGISPMLTKHMISSKGVIIRQGWLVKVKVPIENIEYVSPYEDKMYIFGTRYSSGKMYILTYWKNLVLIELDEPIPVRIIGFKTRPRAIVINVNDHESFISTLRTQIEVAKKERRVK